MIKSDSRINLVIMLFLIITSFGQVFGQANNKANQQYVGTYRTSDPTGCKVELIITSLKDGLHYSIKVNAKKQEGRLKITKMGGDVYVNFVGLYAKKPKAEVEGQYMDNSIVIQNTGNAMNNYLIFSQCDQKYIEMAKVKNKVTPNNH